MPEATARIFSMREFLGLEVGKICKELEITTSNYWVVLQVDPQTYADLPAAALV